MGNRTQVGGWFVDGDACCTYVNNQVRFPQNETCFVNKSMLMGKSLVKMRGLYIVEICF